MNASNTARALLATVVLCAIALLSSSAFAQARATDGPRLRGGFSLVAGPYVAPVAAIAVTILRIG
jgi:hypothetical protein